MVLVRGGGDIATGIVHKLWRSGLSPVVLEVAKPSTIRRSVALSSAVYEGSTQVEDMPARLAGTAGDCAAILQSGAVPVLVDEKAESIPHFCPAIVVDAILAKRNLGTHRGMAALTIGVGPGFTAPDDVDAVVETMRGHRLGALIVNGSALANTGVPGEFAGKSKERVIHAPCGGRMVHKKHLGDFVQEGEVLFYLDTFAVVSPLTGVLRGLIAEGFAVTPGLKVADVDPRAAEQVDCHTISDKARCVGGAVLEACLWLGRQKGISSTSLGLTAGSIR